MATQPSSSSQAQSNAQSVDSSVKLHKPSLPDIGWKFNSVGDLKNLRRVTCDFCLTESTGGFSRAKQHQLGRVGNVRPCTKTPEEVKLVLKESEENRVAKVNSISAEVHEDDDERENLQEISRLLNGKRPAEVELGNGSAPAVKKGTKGPLDILFYQKPEQTIGKAKQTNVKDGAGKEAREKTNEYIALFFFFFYMNGIAFNVAKSRSFKLMVLWS